MRHQLASKFFDERNPNNLDIAGVAICAFGPLSTFTRRVNRDYTAEYKTKADTLFSMDNTKEIANCESACINMEDFTCESFSVTPNGDGTFDCAFYPGAYPGDDDMEVKSTTTVYARNDASAFK
jgi:hypothetical protein